MSANLTVSDDFLTEELSNLYISKINKEQRISHYKSVNLHDNFKNKNNKTFDSLSKRILKRLGVESVAFGTVVNSFGPMGQPLGPHDYIEHDGKKVNAHVLYFMTESDEVTGGEVFYSKKRITTNLSSEQNEFIEILPLNNRLVEAPPEWDRFSRIIFKSRAPVVHVNIVTYNE